MSMVRAVSVGILLSVSGVAASLAQIVNKPPVPQWLRVDASTTQIERHFSHKGRLLKAILLVASDAKATISVNQRQAGTIAGNEPNAVSLDLTRFLKEGENQLLIESTPSATRIAALMEINGDFSAQQWIASDDQWQTAKATKAVPLGAVDATTSTAPNPFDLKKTFDAYNSWQLARPGSQNQATDPATLVTPPGFQVELLRSSAGEDGSWVSMAFDPQGRITIAREKHGLLQWDPRTNQMRVIEDTLLECRGLLYAHGALFANANNSKGLYRLRDLDGDGTFEDLKELMHTEGGVGHGRNHIKLAPDGRIWVAHGNNVLLPSPLSPRSPMRNYQPDQVLPNPWDSIMFDGNVELPAGHVLALDPESGETELIAGGFRNPLDLAFNREGECFTFDADMERDVGASWYMPTRVLHVVSSAEYGWRRGTGRFPSWYVDTYPSVIDIGLSSPTGIFFGYGAKFPSAYQDALFLLDWAYGRIIAVHTQPKGSTYTATQETFISGRPLNVTDGCIGPDGAMWFITGGRGTQSGLYRVTYQGTPSAEAKAPIAYGDIGIDLRTLRHRLEAFHSGIAPDQQQSALKLIVPQLAHADPMIHLAARRALEELPIVLWKKQLLTTSSSWPAIQGCVALARVGDRSHLPEIVSCLTSPSWKDLPQEQQHASLRAISIAIARWGDPEEPQRQALLSCLDPVYPTDSFPMNQDLCRLLVRLKSSRVLDASLPLITAAATSEELLFYPAHLRYLKDGWTEPKHRIIFEALNRAEKHNGASSFFKAIQDTRLEMAATLSVEESQRLASIIYPPKPVVLAPHTPPGLTFKNWQMEDLLPRLPEVSKGRDYASAKAALMTAQCVFCHRVSNDPSLPAGLFGPDLVQVSARFSRRDLLDHVLNPSKVIDEKFRYLTLTKTDGSIVSGTLESEDDERVILKPNPLSPETIEVGKSLIRDRKLSDTSPMPPGLLNTLHAEQILDLLAWFEAAGDPKHPSFQP